MLSRNINYHRCLTLSVFGHIFKTQIKTVFTKRAPDKQLTTTAEVPGCTSVLHGAMAKRKAPPGIFTNEPQPKMADKNIVDNSPVYSLQSVVSAEVDMDRQSASEPVNKPSKSLQDPSGFSVNNDSDPLCFATDRHSGGSDVLGSERLLYTAQSPALRESSFKTSSSNPVIGCDVVSESIQPLFPTIAHSENISGRQSDTFIVEKSETNVFDPVLQRNLNSENERRLEVVFQTAEKHMEMQNSVKKHLESKETVSKHLEGSKLIEKDMERDKSISQKRKSQVCERNEVTRDNSAASPSKLFKMGSKTSKDSKTAKDSKVTQSTKDIQLIKHTSSSKSVEGSKSTRFTRGTACGKAVEASKEFTRHGVAKSKVCESKSLPKTKVSSFSVERPGCKSGELARNISCKTKHMESCSGSKLTKCLEGKEQQTGLSAQSDKCDKVDKQPSVSKTVLRNKPLKPKLNYSKTGASDSSSISLDKSSKPKGSITPKKTVSALSKCEAGISKDPATSAPSTARSNSKTVGAKKPCAESTSTHSVAEQKAMSKAKCNSSISSGAVIITRPKTKSASRTEGDPKTESVKSEDRSADSIKGDSRFTSGTKDVTKLEAPSVKKPKTLSASKGKSEAKSERRNMSSGNILSSQSCVTSKHVGTYKRVRNKSVKSTSTKASVSGDTLSGCTATSSVKTNISKSECHYTQSGMHETSTSKSHSGHPNSNSGSSSSSSNLHILKHRINMPNSTSQPSAQLRDFSAMKNKSKSTVLPAKLLEQVKQTVSKNVEKVANQVLTLEVQSCGSMIESPGKPDYQPAAHITTSDVAPMKNKEIEKVSNSDDGHLSIVAAHEIEQSVGDGETTTGNNKIVVSHSEVTVGSNEVTAGSNEVNVGSNEVTVGSNEVTVGSNEVTVGSNEVTVSDSKATVDGGEDTTVTEDFLSSLPFAETELDSDVDGVYDISPLFSESFDREYIRSEQKAKKAAKKREKEKRRKEKKQLDKKDKTADAEDNKSRQPRPNYFIAVQITNPQIKDRLAAVQETILGKNKHLEKIMIKMATIHLTLMVMSLTSEDDMARARLALDECGSVLRSWYMSRLLQLNVSGLGTFRNQVLFAKVSPGPALEEMDTIADSVRQLMNEHEVLLTDNKPFTPHITIMKMTKANAWFKKNVAKRIEPDLYKDFLTADFGHQVVNQLQLCSMQRKSQSGYYQVEHVVNFGPHDPDDDNSTERKETSGKSGDSVPDKVLKERSKKIVEKSVLAAVNQFRLESGQKTLTPFEQDIDSAEIEVGKMENLPGSDEHRHVDDSKLQQTDWIEALGDSMAKSCLEEVFSELKLRRNVEMKDTVEELGKTDVVDTIFNTSDKDGLDHMNGKQEFEKVEQKDLNTVDELQKINLVQKDEMNVTEKKELQVEKEKELKPLELNAVETLSKNLVESALKSAMLEVKHFSENKKDICDDENTFTEQEETKQTASG